MWKPMTVCIAAICGGKIPVPPEDYIVAVSDTMFTGLTSSIDKATRKMEPFADDWLAMMAADDVTQCVPIIERAATYFHKRANSLQVARSCLKRAYQKQLSELAADMVLGRFGLDMEGFLKSRSRRFTDKTSDLLIAQMREIKVDWQFLAFGFDSDKTPHLFTVEEPGIDSVYDKPGFCAVGSGRYAADTLLFYLEQNPKCSLHHTLINVLFAKFMAEKAGAGTNTYIFIKKAGSTECATDLFLEPTIRQAWMDEGHPHIPKGLLDKIAALHISAK
jgi:hypothetical protein